MRRLNGHEVAAVNEATRTADLVLEGGGVKGIAHVGAVSALAEGCQYSFRRVAGSSAGAVVAALIAAGVRPARMRELMSGGPGALDYRRVPEMSLPGRIPILGKPLSILLEQGIYEGDYLRDWIHHTLMHETGKVTFGQLRLNDPSREDLTGDRGYSLVVMVADVSRGQLVRLPWDYCSLYGLNPDKMSIADAVRASASIPFFFQPFKLPWADGKNTSYLVDGGVLSDFPIEVFDRTDGVAPRWPTFGIKLERKPADGVPVNHITDTLNFTHALLETMINGNDQVHLADPSVESRTMFVDTLGISSEDFELSPEDRQRLFESGQDAAQKFMQSWNWEGWKATYASDRGPDERVRAARGERRGVAVAASPCK